MAMGFANLSDAMEMMILSILAPALHCHWQITKVEQATITTVVFLGNKKTSFLNLDFEVSDIVYFQHWTFS
jgi:hypothetical protein